MFSLKNKKVLVAGIANDQSIAWGIAKAMKTQGADLAITYLNEKAEPHVRPLAEQLGAEIIMPLDVSQDGSMEALYEQIRAQWGQLDTVVHAIAFCPKDDLLGRVVDCSREGYGKAMEISVHSFIRMVRLAEPLMPQGGTCMTVSFYGSERVVENYNLMGSVKAALESVTRYMAAELGSKQISVHALSPGPLSTRAASGIGHFDKLLNDAAQRAPTHQLASIEDVGAYAAFLASDEAANITGGIHYIDGGANIMS